MERFGIARDLVETNKVEVKIDHLKATCTTGYHPVILKNESQKALFLKNFLLAQQQVKEVKIVGEHMVFKFAEMQIVSFKENWGKYVLVPLKNGTYGFHSRPTGKNIDPQMVRPGFFDFDPDINPTDVFFFYDTKDGFFYRASYYELEGLPEDYSFSIGDIQYPTLLSSDKKIYGVWINGQFSRMKPVEGTKYDSKVSFIDKIINENRAIYQR